MLTVIEISKLTTCDPNERHQVNSASVLGSMYGKAYRTKREIAAEARRRLAAHDKTVTPRERLGLDRFECIASTGRDTVQFTF